MSLQNPEGQFRRFAPDYSGIRVKEPIFAVMADPYGKTQGYQMDILTPETNDTTPRPVICFVHGGAFMQPCDRKQSYISYFAQKLIPAGYALAVPDYPLFDNENDLSAAGDEYAQSAYAAAGIHRAAAFLREHAADYRLDTRQMILMGGSAGAIGGFRALTEAPQEFSAFVNLWGAPAAVPNVQNFPPVCSVHGTADTTVPYDRESPLQQALAAAGIPHELYTIEGAGHTPIPQALARLPDILTFIRTQLTKTAK